MESFTANLNTIVSLGTILGQIFILGIVILWLGTSFGQKSTKKKAADLLSKIGSGGLIMGFVVALTSVVLSIVYSDVIGFQPCKLCWIQRIFLYPQVIILGLTLWKKTRDAIAYCLSLSIIGAVIAAYNFYGQSFNPSILPACDVSGGASCAVRFFVEFGYITIPMMSLTAFSLIIVSMLLARFSENKQLS